MGNLVLSLSTKSLGIKSPDEFTQAIKIIRDEQPKFLHHGFEIGLAYRMVMGIGLDHIIKNAKEHSNVPVSIESEGNVLGLTDPEVMAHVVNSAKACASAYKGHSDIVKQRSTIRLVFGNYVADDSGINKTHFEKLKDNIGKLNDSCYNQQVYALIENVPEDAKHTTQLAAALSQGMEGNQYVNVQFMVDIGNLVEQYSIRSPGDIPDCVSITAGDGLLGGLHLKQSSGYNALPTLTQGGDINIKKVLEMGGVLKSQVYPLVIEPATQNLSIDQGLREAMYVNGLVR